MRFRRTFYPHPDAREPPSLPSALRCNTFILFFYLSSECAERCCSHSSPRRRRASPSSRRGLLVGTPPLAEDMLFTPPGSRAGDDIAPVEVPNWALLLAGTWAGRRARRAGCVLVGLLPRRPLSVDQKASSRSPLTPDLARQAPTASATTGALLPAAGEAGRGGLAPRASPPPPRCPALGFRARPGRTGLRLYLCAARGARVLRGRGGCACVGLSPPASSPPPRPLLQPPGRCGARVPGADQVRRATGAQCVPSPARASSLGGR